jgi:predicted homoserine dehydrogenase-like protein
VILIDTALRRRAESGRPIRVAMVGAGFMARATANQFINVTPGIRLVAISNRNLDAARHCYEEAGVTDVRVVESVAELEDAIGRGQAAITTDAMLLARAGNVEVLHEVTGAVDFAARVVMEAIAHGKHIVLMDAELHGTVGPILKVHADRAGVIFTDSDGDQPGVEMNLDRYVRAMGLRPLVLGNNKGLQDPYRTPATQQAFAARWGQKADMVASFADGTKMSFEQAVVANATGFHVPQRGMYGWNHPGHVDELTTRYDYDQLMAMGGIVDYVVGATPAPGVYCIATVDDPKQRFRLELYKLGPGPLYSFYHPYHLCHLEVPFSISRVVDFADTIVAPRGAPTVEVITTAKRDLQAGETIDGMGGYMVFGQCENASVQRAERLLPVGLAEGCRLRRVVAKDAALSYDDVELPPGRFVDELRAEQDAHFAPRPASEQR